MSRTSRAMHNPGIMSQHRGETRIIPSPCFNWRACHNLSTHERAGKSLCDKCGERVIGLRYPLRAPGTPSIWDPVAERRDRVQLGLRGAPRDSA